MKLPRLMLGCAILLWGWQWQAPGLAAALALLVELAMGLRWQRPTSLQTLSRISNGCTLLFIALTVYFAFTVEAAQSVLAVIKWTPILLLPLMLVIALSGMAQVPLAIISSVVRRRNQGAGQSANQPANQFANPPADQGAGQQYNLAWPYLALWLLSAGVANRVGPWFYCGLCLLCGWALWSLRPASQRWGGWLALLLMAVALGAGINQGLYRLQGLVEQAAMDWMANISEEDPLRSETSLGHIGQLKLGNGIALRVQTSRPLLEPVLLRTAAYNLYLAPNWVLSGKNGFYWMRPSHSGLWQVSPGPGQPSFAQPVDSQRNQQMEIDGVASHINPVLALPPGVLQIEGQQFNGLTRNNMGTLQANMGREHFHYRLHYQPGLLDQSAPDAQDLIVPRHEQANLSALAQQLHLSGQPTARAMHNLKRWFASEFRYSTFRQGNSLGHSAINDFLQHNRQGHCEHFASASVLLLRAAGIPARYAVGYSVQEADRFGTGYVVRQRHAHAWTLVWVNGMWQDFDTTPAAWSQQERQQAPWWEVVADGWNWLAYQIRDWQIRPWHAALLLLALGLLWRLRRAAPKAKKPKRRQQPVAQAMNPFERSGASPFYQIEQHLAKLGCSRNRGEALEHWLRRIEPQLGDAASLALAQIIALHYRCRFGPPGNPAAEQLSEACQYWLRDFHSCLKENAPK